MSPVQKSDDPARGLLALWLGPTGAWRWWFDATYTEWAIGMALAVTAFVVLWLVLPLGALLIILALAWGRWASWSMHPDKVERITRTVGAAARTRLRRVITAIVLVMEAMLFGSPHSWLMPMHWYLALPGAVYVAARLVKRARPYLDADRSVTYWVRALWDVTKGPRPLRKPLHIVPIIDLGAVLIDMNQKPVDLRIVAKDETQKPLKKASKDLKPVAAKVRRAPTKMIVFYSIFGTYELLYGNRTVPAIRRGF